MTVSNRGRVRLGLVGIGKIARDQHLPAIMQDARFELVATASPYDQLDGLPGHPDIGSLINGGHDLEAVSLCTPPEGRYELAHAAIEAGLHVMLEKPPAATLSEIVALAERARTEGVTFFTTWHSREAGAVEPARRWLADKRIKTARIVWREDIRRWHPGQDWILAAGGFGVFDPGINALSIVTRLLPEPLLLKSATLDIPDNRQAPLAAQLEMRSGSACVTADFDFLQTGPQTWDIEIDTDAGTLRLGLGGSVIALPGEAPRELPNREYTRLYARFAELLHAGESDVDIRPFQLVADAFLVGERRSAAPFSF